MVKPEATQAEAGSYTLKPEAALAIERSRAGRATEHFATL
jgi:hypothetical protein